MTDSIADRAWRTFLATAWRPDFDGSATDDAPGEPRGNTHWGIIRATWKAAMAHNVVVSDQNFDTAPQSDFGVVLRAVCWQSIRGDQLSLVGGACGAGVAIVLANMAMATGAYRAVMLLQRTLGHLVVDGAMGPATFAATIRAITAGLDIIGDMTRADEAFFASLPKAPMFLHGWTRRAEAFAVAARDLSHPPPQPSGEATH